MVDMTRKEILPAVSSYVKELSDALLAKAAAVPGLSGAYEKELISRLSGLTDGIAAAADGLDTDLAALAGEGSVTAEADAIRDVVLARMDSLRALCDEAETITAAKFWPFPTYGELLFGVR